MRYRIVGADKHTGEDIDTVIDAADKFHATREAREGGILVSEVTAIDDAIQRVSAQPIVQASPANAPQIIYAQQRSAPPAPTPTIIMQMPAAPQAAPSVAQPQVIHQTTQVSVRTGGGCLSAIVKGIVLVVVVLLLIFWWGAWSLKNAAERSTPPTSTSPPSEPKPVVSPSVPKPLVTERVPTASNRTAAPTSSPIVPPVAAARNAPAPLGPSRMERIAAAELACRNALHKRADYVAAKKLADDLELKVKASRADPQKPQLATLSQQWMDAKNKLARMEADALASDPGVQAAKN